MTLLLCRCYLLGKTEYKWRLPVHFDGKDVAGTGGQCAGEGTGEHDIAGLEGDAELGELVGQPGNTAGRVAEGGCADPLDSWAAVLAQHHADGAQVSGAECPTPGAEGKPTIGGVISHSIDELDAPVFDPAIDDFDRDGDGFGSGEDVLERDAWASEAAADEEGEFAFDAWLNKPAGGGDGKPAFGGDIPRRPEAAVVGFMYAELLLHSEAGQSDFATEDPLAVGEAHCGPLGLDSVGGRGISEAECLREGRDGCASAPCVFELGSEVGNALVIEYVCLNH